MKVVGDGSREGIYIETNPETAGNALAIQSAFEAAGLHATVAIHEVQPRDTVIVNLGPASIP